MTDQRFAGPAIAGDATERSTTVQIGERWRLSSLVDGLTLTHGVLLTLVLAGLLGFWRLDHYPRTWFDEGSYLEVSRNIASEGDYFSRSPDGTRDFAPVIAVGPTVLLPAAGTQEWLGSSLWTGRLVGVVYLMLASAAVYALAHGLFGSRSALVTIAILFSMPALDWLGTGRQLLGEVPAVLFLILGAAVAFRMRGLTAAALAGALFGLTLITKGQYLLVLPLTILLVAAFDFFGSRVRPLRWYAVLGTVAAAAYAIWGFVLLNLIGEGNIVENYRILRDTSGGSILVFEVERMRAAWAMILGPRSLFLVIPTVLFGLYLIRREPSPERRLMLTAITTFQICWLAWFAMASIAWPRYAFPALVVSAIYAGAMTTGLLDELLKSRPLREAQRRSRTMTAGLALALIGLLVCAGAYRQIAPVITADEQEPQEFAALLDQLVPAGAVVDGWEPEINFLTEREMQYPPNGSLDSVVRAAWLGSPEEVDLSGSLKANYLVIGHFGRWVGVYDAAIDSGSYRLVASQGGFELYERIAAQ